MHLQKNLNFILKILGKFYNKLYFRIVSVYKIFIKNIAQKQMKIELLKIKYFGEKQIFNLNPR